MLTKNWTILMAALLATLAAASSTLAQEQDPLRDSVVRVHASRRSPDPFKPWARRSPMDVTGSGVVIDGQRILTNAHVVQYSTEILIESEQVRRRIPAEVVGFAPGIDLAILSVEDETFFETHPAVTMNAVLPADRENVLVYGFPTGGESLSVTKGVVSRIDFSAFYYGTAGIRIQIDAAVNDGNSGGPAFVDGTMIGLVFSRMTKAENIGYLIPVEEIGLFLEDVKDGNYDGKYHLNDQIRPMENDALREMLEFPSDMSGVYMQHVVSNEPEYPLREWDVVTHIGDSAIDDQGSVVLEDGRQMGFQVLVQRSEGGGSVPLRIWRDGASLSFEVPLTIDDRYLLPYLEGEYPSYFVYGPLVFSPATYDYARGFDRDPVWRLMVQRQSPLVAQRRSRQSFEGEGLVVLASPPFPHAAIRGYDIAPGWVVRSVNDVDVTSFTHFIEVLRDAEDEYIVIEFWDRRSETIVLKRDGMDAVTEEILQDNGIRKQMSDDVREVWGR